MTGSLGIALQRGLETQGLNTLGIPWGLILLMLDESVPVGEPAFSSLQLERRA